MKAKILELFYSRPQGLRPDKSHKIFNTVLPWLNEEIFLKDCFGWKSFFLVIRKRLANVKILMGVAAMITESFHQDRK